MPIISGVHMEQGVPVPIIGGMVNPGKNVCGKQGLVYWNGLKNSIFYENTFFGKLFKNLCRFSCILAGLNKL